jgi:hypothetical protein
MAPTPFRRRKAARTIRNLAIAEAALALAKDRALAAAPGHRSRRPRGRLLLVGGAVAVAGAAALLKRDRVAGLLTSRSGEPEPATAPPAPQQSNYDAPAPPPPAPPVTPRQSSYDAPGPATAPPPPAPPVTPQQSNYDAPGPVANTATPVPAPDPQVPEPIDEATEEAAAAAEARAVGGTPDAYAGPEGEPATAAERPLAEAGEGESEGAEQAEADLQANAESRDSAPSDAERQVEETIEAAGQPSSGETPETTRDAQETFLPPAAPDAATADESKADESKAGEDDSDDWRTWSGRSVQP